MIEDYRDDLIALNAIITNAFPKVKIYTAGTGREGICLVQKYNPDVVILEVNLPDIPGFEVCALIRDDSALCHIPVIFLSNHISRDSRIRSLEAGGIALIPKPIDEAEILGQINTILMLTNGFVKKSKEIGDPRKRVSDCTIQYEKELAERKRIEEELRLSNRILTQNRAAMLNLLSDLKEESESRKRINRMIRESEENYREIFNSTNEAIMIDDAETGRIIDVNETTLKMYGYESKEEIFAGIWGFECKYSPIH